VKTFLKNAAKGAVLHPILKSLFRNRMMRYPTFGQDLNARIFGSYDYYRFATLGLAAQRVKDEAIPGAFAEVGVFKGEMSRFLAPFCGSRNFYLFDTFAGFPEEHLEGRGKDTRFRDTDEETVRGYFQAMPNVKVMKGMVPGTLEGAKDEKFAFVLLDLDLFPPTIESLKFFYPRMSKGGYLILHDFNNPESDQAIRRALKEFLADKPELPVEIGDVWGSVLFRKI
jgi:O-methyltransferase